jgi:hypothetical protein
MFLGIYKLLSYFYQKLFKDCCPIDMTYKQGQIQMGQKYCENFQIFKNAFITTSHLIHTNPSNPFILEAYASNFALGAVLS